MGIRWDPDLIAEAAKGLDRPVYYLCGAPGFVEAAFRSLVSSGSRKPTPASKFFAGMAPRPDGRVPASARVSATMSVRSGARRA